MSNLPSVPLPKAIKALTVLLPVLALVQLGLAALLTFGTMMSAATGGNSEGYVGVVFGIALVPGAIAFVACAIVTIIAIFTLRRRSRIVRIAVTVSSLTTIAATISAMIPMASQQNAEAAYMMMYALLLYAIPLLVVFAVPVSVLIVLWGAPTARAFFMTPPTSL